MPQNPLYLTPHGLPEEQVLLAVTLGQMIESYDRQAAETGQLLWSQLTPFQRRRIAQAVGQAFDDKYLEMWIDETMDQALAPFLETAEMTATAAAA